MVEILPPMFLTVVTLPHPDNLILGIGIRVCNRFRRIGISLLDASSLIVVRVIGTVGLGGRLAGSLDQKRSGNIRPLKETLRRISPLCPGVVTS